MADRLAICVDIGSTFTKALLVDLDAGEVLATAEHPTTIGTDVLEGYDACRVQLVASAPAGADVASAEVHVCSSAGGGLRIAVVGNEELVTAEAGRRVALSSGGKVVAVVAAADRAPDDPLWRELADSVAPDVVLLTGGTDGGNREVLVRAAEGLVAGGWAGPVVVAGNADGRDEVSAVLADLPHVVADNVVPRIGVLAPESARAAVREVFLSHVIGGKHLSSRPEFARLVRGATPDVVLTGVELLARGLDDEHPGVGDVVVVDVGGATTDVHSVVLPVDESDPDDRSRPDGSHGPPLDREVVARTPVTRTVEGDLGMRWSAVSTVEEAGLADDEGLLAAAEHRRRDPSYVPDEDAGLEADETIARAAVGLAMRRHAGRSRVVVSPEGRVVERTGTDLREVALVVGSGGVLRHGRPGVAARVLAGSVGADLAGGWQLPERAEVVVDTDYVLAAVGLLAGPHPAAAHALARRLAAAAAR